MEADRTELTNLADANPQKVEELKALYEAWAERCGVQPWPVKKPKPQS
jgi:arylsulfatase